MKLRTSLATIDDLCPGDVFYTTQASIDGCALCVWVKVESDHCNIGYVTLTGMKHGRFRKSKEVFLPHEPSQF